MGPQMGMMRAGAVLALLTAGLTGCAVLRGERGPSEADRLELGLAALAAGDFAGARPPLEALYLERWQEPAGRQALLALAAAELDARNPERRLSVGAELAGRYLGMAGTPRWTVPAAESLYLLAVELGAQEEALARAEQTRQLSEAERADALRALRTAQPGGRPLPQSERESVPEQIERMAALHRAERDELQRRVAQLEQRLAARETELNDANAELERIRRTLKR